MTLRPLSSREQVLSAVGLVILCFAAVFSWGIEPMIERWRRLEGQILAQEMRLTLDRRILAQGKALRAQYARYLDSLQTQGSDEEEVGRLLQEVDRISGEMGTGVRMHGLRPRAPTDGGTYRLYGVEAETMGPLQDLCRLIYLLEQSPAGLRVARLQLGPAGRGGDELEGRMVITKMILARK